MSVWLTDLADILRAAGVKVVEHTYTQGRYKGKHWKQVGYGGQGYTGFAGIMWHHDASPINQRSPGALGWMMYWARDKFGNDLTPAAAIWVDMDGTWHVYAAGRTNHAGLGSWPELGMVNNANAYVLGIETDHGEGEGWPQVQIDSLRTGTAAIMRAYKLDPAKRLTFHRTYAPGRKTDPYGLDLGQERTRVAALMREPISPKLRALQRQLDRTRAEAQRRRAAGESTAGLPSRIQRLKERIKRLRGR